jgi:predicted DCC family thiol-disulfide oxidoreductase YuxK
MEDGIERLRRQECEGAMPAPPGREQLTVYYDGGCPLCAAEIGLYRRQDRSGSLNLVDVSDAGAVLPSGLSRDAALARFHVLRPDGQLQSGAAAFAALWRSVPGWQVLGRVAQHPRILPLIEAAYRAFLPIRPRLSGLVRAIVRRSVP